MPEEAPRGSITDLLVTWRAGAPGALPALIERVYPELRRMAARRLRAERAEHTLEASALVHEAYLRLVDQRRADWRHRRQFYAVASGAMRRILVDHARARGRHKRRGEQVSLRDEDAMTGGTEIDLLALHEALGRLVAAGHAFEEKVVELRFFGGLTIAETAATLEVGHASVERAWAFARAWLYRELGPARS